MTNGFTGVSQCVDYFNGYAEKMEVSREVFGRFFDGLKKINNSRCRDLHFELSDGSAVIGFNFFGRKVFFLLSRLGDSFTGGRSIPGAFVDVFCVHPVTGVALKTGDFHFSFSGYLSGAVGSSGNLLDLSQNAESVLACIFVACSSFEV